MISPRLVLAGTLAAHAVACQGSDTAGKAAGPAKDSGTEAAAPYTSDVYSNPANWLCLPSIDGDFCHESLDATILRADGSTEVEPHVFAENAPVDCFYVYPTISTDAAANSDLVPDDPEKNVVREQAARLTRVCDVYAPVYRQVTLGSLINPTQFPEPVEERREIAYADVLDSWKHYLSNYNHGRPFVLVGHSQGAGMLRRLVQEQIDGDEGLRGKLVSALLIGGGIAVPDGGEVGVDFQNVPLCRAPADLGCVVGYSTFRSTSPPPANSRFGKPRTGSGVVACNNPASLAGGSAMLTPYFSTKVGGVVAVPNLPAVTTPYVTLPDFLQGECLVRDGFSILEVTVLGDPADPRPDDIGGNLGPDWGLHLADVHVAMGDLVDLVAAEVAALPR